jgi:uncharacterized DUF497 family protein
MQVSAMPWFQFIWDESEGGNVEHVAEHDLTREEVEYVVQNPECLLKSRSSGRPALKGYTADGRYVFVAYEQVDPMTVYVVSAYEVES